MCSRERFVGNISYKNVRVVERNLEKESRAINVK